MFPLGSSPASPLPASSARATGPASSFLASSPGLASAVPGCSGPGAGRLAAPAPASLHRLSGISVRSHVGAGRSAPEISPYCVIREPAASTWCLSRARSRSNSFSRFRRGPAALLPRANLAPGSAGAPHGARSRFRRGPAHHTNSHGPARCEPFRASVWPEVSVGCAVGPPAARCGRKRVPEAPRPAFRYTGARGFRPAFSCRGKLGESACRRPLCAGCGTAALAAGDSAPANLLGPAAASVWMAATFCRRARRAETIIECRREGLRRRF